MSAFSIEKIRQKYRKILDQDENENLDSVSTKPLIAIKKSSGVKRYLTEQNQNISSSKDTHYSNNILLTLKERVAQGIQNMSRKEDEIQSYKEKIIKQEAQLSLLSNQLAQFKNNMQKNSLKIAQQKVSSATLQKEIIKLQKQIQSQFVEKDMIYKQVQFYKEEIKTLKSQKQTLISCLQSQKSDIQKIDRLHCQNNRLRDNIKRLQDIIDQCFKDKKSMNFQNKFYLGKPLKEAKSWFSQNLINQVQHFLTKWQIGHLNKEFINSLVKFIDSIEKNCNKQKKKQCSKVKKSHSRTFSKEHFLSDSNFLGISLTQNKNNNSSIKKSLKKKDIKIDKKMEKRLSFLYEDNKSKNIQNTYQSIFSQYQNALNLALTTSEIKPKHILSLNNGLKSLLKDYLTSNFDKDII